MVHLVPVSLADFAAIKAIALIGVLVIVFLYWDEFKEKRIRRRQQRELEERRRQRESQQK